MLKMIFDLDLTLVDSRIAEPYRPGNWKKAYSLIPEFRQYEGVKDVLQFLRDNGIPYCIVTSSPSTYCIKVCQHWNISTDYTVCYHDVPPGKKKPHPAPILLALKKMSAKPHEVLSFGDRDIDIKASNDANVPSVACLWGAEDKDSVLAAKPIFVIHNPLEIISLAESFKL